MVIKIVVVKPNISIGSTMVTKITSAHNLPEGIYRM